MKFFFSNDPLLILDIGAVPDALVHAFTARETSVIEGPPAKRRKLVSAPQSLRDVNGLSEHGEPIGYIPLAEFSLSLVSYITFGYV